jgi:hypothetical protein
MVPFTIMGMKMKFKFEKFTDTDTSFAARVTIRRTGQIGFNTGAINSFGVRDAEYCILYFDPENRVVGMELTKEKCEGAIQIKKSDANTYVRAKNFCDRYTIDYSKSHRYELKRESATGFLYFELDREQAADEENGDGEETASA